MDALLFLSLDVVSNQLLYIEVMIAAVATIIGNGLEQHPDHHAPADRH